MKVCHYKLKEGIFLPLNNSVPISIKLLFKEFVVDRSDLEQFFPGRFTIRQTIPMRTARFTPVLTDEEIGTMEELANRYYERNR